MAGLLSTDTFIRTLEADGFELAAVGDRLRIRPAARVTPELQADLHTRKSELLPVLWRLAEMRRLAIVAPRAVVYARESARGGPGHCFSCSDPHPSPHWYGRCPACDIASDIYYSTMSMSMITEGTAAEAGR